MKTKWQSVGHGVEFRNHATRKNGVRFDRYFRGRYTVNKESVIIGFGWETEGWTQSKCITELAQFKENKKRGSGPTTLKEKQELENARKQAEEETRKQAEREDLTFKKLVDDLYLPQAKVDKKSWDRDEQLLRDWINPVIGKHRLIDITPFALERIKKHMHEAGKSPRTIEYAFATIRHAFNFARQRALFVGDNPVGKIIIPRPNNRRVRFLSRDEAETLLAALAGKSMQLYRMAAVSLFCGLRFKEIAFLHWSDVDPGNGTLFVRDPKNKDSRTAFMPARIQTLFAQMRTENNGRLVFPSRKGGQMKQASKVFSRTVEELGLNKDIDDQRQKVCFYTLRHTFASWLALQGVPMVTLKELLGHKTLAMTERYSHLAPHSLKAAVGLLDDGTETATIVPIKKGKTFKRKTV